MRLGVFGGTFDPVHYGHLILAEQCREQARLDRVLFVPAARHALKTDHAITPFDRRVEMLQLAIAGHECFGVDELEKGRAGPSYTADTLDELHAQQPDAELFFLVGSDSLPDLPRWHDPQRVVRRAGLIVMERPGHTVLTRDELAAAVGMPASDVRLERVEVPLIDLSSRDIRRRVGAGRSVRYMLPRAVEVYIKEKRLYTGG
ncbi:MAG: nicotinate-nucleotide adenylyltransferase [Gemmataceae bacterium]